MISINLYLILASGEINGIGFWLIDKTYDEFPTIENKDLLECHRKELVSEESAKDILFAINLNLHNLMNDLKKDGFHFQNPPKGICLSLIHI